MRRLSSVDAAIKRAQKTIVAVVFSRVAIVFSKAAIEFSKAAVDSAALCRVPTGAMSSPTDTTVDAPVTARFRGAKLSFFFEIQPFSRANLSNIT